MIGKEDVSAQLVAAGYEFTQTQPRVSGAPDWRPDFVAWAADPGGTLVPWAVVEASSSAAAVDRPERVLVALARARDLLGTVDHYVVVGGRDWYRGDPGLKRLEPVTGPVAPPNGGEGEIADVQLVTALLSEELARAAARSREGGQTPDLHFNPGIVLDFAGFMTHSGSWVPINKATLWQARRRAIVDFERRGRRAGEYTSHKSVSSAVAQLAGAKLTAGLLDPFCGAGSFLWDCIDYAEDHGATLETVSGIDINERTADVARSIAAAAPIQTEITVADVFRETPLPSRCVVSAPPIGAAVIEPRTMLNGDSARDGNLVALDCIIRSIATGGRAVMHLPAAITFDRVAERYRQFLASEFRVAALIGLPVGAVPDTNARSVLMVIDQESPTDTFVAQLGDDWENQLTPGGAAMEAALAHVDGERR